MRVPTGPQGWKSLPFSIWEDTSTQNPCFSALWKLMNFARKKTIAAPQNTAKYQPDWRYCRERKGRTHCKAIDGCNKLQSKIVSRDQWEHEKYTRRGLLCCQQLKTRGKEEARTGFHKAPHSLHDSLKSVSLAVVPPSAMANPPHYHKRTPASLRCACRARSPFHLPLPLQSEGEIFGQHVITQPSASGNKVTSVVYEHVNQTSGGCAPRHT